MSIDVDLLLELQVVLQGALLVLGGRWAQKAHLQPKKRRPLLDTVGAGQRK